MGGRGSTSGAGGVSGYKITPRSGESQEYFFAKRGAINYYKRGIGGYWDETPNNMSQQEFVKRVKSNGGKAEKISNSGIKNRESDYKREREKTEKGLNDSWFRAAPRPRKGLKGH